jgi:transposase
MPKDRQQRSKRRKTVGKVDATEGLPLLNGNAAGIDVGSAEHYVAVPTDRDAEPVQSFGSFTADLHRMAGWLKNCRIQTVVMQATGVYGMARYDVLEG